jgi:hypothetical protein
MKSFILVLLVFLSLATFATKPRIIVLTDIGGDPDDEESMVCFLLYSNEFEARSDWYVRSFKEANHNPVASFNGDTGKDIIYFDVASRGKSKTGCQRFN